MKALLGCIVSALVLSGCVGFVAPVEVDAQPKPKKAYIYANLSIDYADSLAWAKQQHIKPTEVFGWVFKCVNGEEFTIGFRPNVEVYLMPVPASECSWTDIVYGKSIGHFPNRKNAPRLVMKNLKFDPMTAYYLADVKAEISEKVDGQIVTTSWKMTSVRDRYVTTTEEMKAKYKAFSGIKTVNLMEMTPSEEPAKTEEDKAE